MVCTVLFRQSPRDGAAETQFYQLLVYLSEGPVHVRAGRSCFFDIKFYVAWNLCVARPAPRSLEFTVPPIPARAPILEK